MVGMSQNYINDLIEAATRAARPDVRQLKEILILCGMPGETKNIQYLSFNNHTWTEGECAFTFAAVAVLNNRRAAEFRLKGNQKKISQIIFHKLWTFNPLDYFLNRLRCNSEMMDIMAAASSDYTLLGILTQEKERGKGYYRHKYLEIQPVAAIPKLSEYELKRVIEFETTNHIRKVTLKGFTVYRQIS